MRTCDHFEPLRLYSAVSVHCPHLLKLLNVDFNPDSYSAFHSNADQDPANYTITDRDLASQNNEDPDLQLCFSGHIIQVSDLIIGLSQVARGVEEEDQPVLYDSSGPESG
jgi:hypothetical protein